MYGPYLGNQEDVTVGRRYGAGGEIIQWLLYMMWCGLRSDGVCCQMIDGVKYVRARVCLSKSLRLAGRVEKLSWLLHALLVYV